MMVHRFAIDFVRHGTRFLRVYDDLLSGFPDKTEAN
jgi:hypothetical protein